MMERLDSWFPEKTVDTPETDHRSPGTSDEDDFTQGNMDESLRDGSMNEFAKGEEEHDVGVESDPVTLDWFMELYNDYIEYLPYIVYVLLVMFFCHYMYVLFVRRNTEVPKKQEFSRESRKKRNDDAINQIQNLETASNEQKQEIGMLVQQCESLKQQKRNLNDALDKVNQEKRRLEDDCDTLKKQKRDLEIRNDKLNKDLNLEIEKRLATREWVRKHLPTVCTLPQSTKNDDRVTPVLAQFMLQLNAKLPHALDIETQRGEDIDVHHGNPIFLPCIAAARVGSDVKAALDKAKIGKGQVILIIFHHLAAHNCKIPTERKLSDKTLLDRCVGIVDCVYWMGSMYDCEANTKAFQNITDLLRWNVHQDDLLTLWDLVDDKEK